MNDKEKLLNLLHKDEDSHWTQSGEVRLEAIKSILSKSLTREAVNVLIPGLSRITLEELRLKSSLASKEKELREIDFSKQETGNLEKTVQESSELPLNEIIQAPNELSINEASQESSELLEERLAGLREGKTRIEKLIFELVQEIAKRKQARMEESRMSPSEVIKQFSASSAKRERKANIVFARPKPVRPLKT